jgi:hypothetical protein
MHSLKDYTGCPDRHVKEKARQVRQEKGTKKKLSEEQALREKILTSHLHRSTTDQSARAPSILDNVRFKVTAGGETVSVTLVDASGGTRTVKPGGRCQRLARLAACRADGSGSKGSLVHQTAG